jgi:hypothetical protein
MTQSVIRDPVSILNKYQLRNFLPPLLELGREKNDTHKIKYGQIRKPGKENLHRAFSSLFEQPHQFKIYRMGLAGIPLSFIS